jgi:hypothetical protein
MTCRQRNELLASAQEKRIASDADRTRSKLNKRREGFVDIGLVACPQDLEWTATTSVAASSRKVWARCARSVAIQSWPRICPPVSFWNFSSAAAFAPSVATARHASPVTRNRLLVAFFLVLIEAILGRSSAPGRLLKHGLQMAKTANARATVGRACCPCRRHVPR